MRKILFRAKAINRDPNGNYRTSYQNGDWVYGLVSKVWSKYDEAEMTNVSGISGIEVDYKTLGQYTGLDDKNGMPIFEGDIVIKRTYQGKKLFPVTFTDGMFHCGWGGGSSTATHGYTLADKQIEVVGNIYDNPELVK